MRILVIDDEPDVLLLCRVNLTFEGHGVMEAADAVRGLELARRERPDLIVLDVMLPHRDGFSVLDELQERPETRDIPVILLTAKARREDQVRGWNAGCALYLTKPFSPTALCKAVETIASMTPEERRAQIELSLRQLSLMR